MKMSSSALICRSGEWPKVTIDLTKQGEKSNVTVINDVILLTSGRRSMTFRLETSVMLPADKKSRELS